MRARGTPLSFPCEAINSGKVKLDPKLAGIANPRTMLRASAVRLLADRRRAEPARNSDRPGQHGRSSDDVLLDAALVHTVQQ